jgi:hypothetical protein
VEKILQYNKQYYWDQEKIKLGRYGDKTMQQRRKREMQITERLTKKRSSSGKSRKRLAIVVVNTPSLILPFYVRLVAFTNGDDEVEPSRCRRDSGGYWSLVQPENANPRPTSHA